MKSLSALLGVSFLVLASSASAQDAGAPPDAGTAEAPPPADDGAAAATPADTGEPSDAPPPSGEPPPTVAAPPVDAAAQFAAAATLAHPPTDETVWNISAGATLNTGNTRSFAGNVGTHFSLRRGSHQVGADFQTVYGISQGIDAAASMTAGHPVYASEWTNTSQNITANARYDFFLTDADALFVAVAGRRDPFAGLDFRGQVQAGYLRNFYAVENHRLWGEIGYDFTYDDFHYAAPPMAGVIRPHDRTAHSARFYVGYDNHLNAFLTLTTGVEAVLRPYAVMGQGDFGFRINWITQLNVKVDTRFSLGLGFTLRYDSVPPGAATDNVDTITVLNLIYTLI